jgi:hypothetical protein
LAVDAVAVVDASGAEAAAALGATVVAAGTASPFRDCDELAGRRRRLRLAPPLDRSGVAEVVGVDGVPGAAASPGGPAPSAVALMPFAAGVVRRLRRLRDADAAGAAGSCPIAGAGVETVWRVTLAPTSPSAHRAPSAVCTSTRQTTIAVATPPTGGRFWVSVQRA